MSQAMALARAETGANLVLLDRNAAGIETTAHTIRQLGRKTPPTHRHATGADHIDRVFATVDREFGRVECWPRPVRKSRYKRSVPIRLAEGRLESSCHVGRVIGDRSAVIPHLLGVTMVRRVRHRPPF
jgi:NAD(P)-dependent dehydrogenase (short-subunit alcohol dehydrogenase family)